MRLVRKEVDARAVVEPEIVVLAAELADVGISRSRACGQG